MNNLCEVKTETLEGVALDWAVGRAAGVDFGPDSLQSPREVIVGGYQNRPRVHWSPTRYWSQLGPLIKVHGISILAPGTAGPEFIARASDVQGMFSHPCDEMLVICRAIAARHFGETVGVPIYLLEAA